MLKKSHSPWLQAFEGKLGIVIENGYEEVHVWFKKRSKVR
jgi:hypothetical protein